MGNGLYLEGFSAYLNNEKTSFKTKDKHMENVSFFVMEYLDRVGKDAIEGIDDVAGFLGYFLINKCMWSTGNTVKENITSIKKFYKYMLNEGFISKASYNDMDEIIKHKKAEWIASADAFDDEDEYFDSDDFLEVGFDDEMDEAIMELYYDEVHDFYNNLKEIIALKPWTWLSSHVVLSIGEPGFFEDYFMTLADNAIFIHEGYKGLKGVYDARRSDLLDYEPMQFLNGYGIVFGYEKDLKINDASFIGDSKVIFEDKSMVPRLIEFNRGYEPTACQPSVFGALLEALERAMLLFRAGEEEQKYILDLPITEIYGYYGDQKGSVEVNKLFDNLFNFNHQLFKPDLSSISGCNRKEVSWIFDVFYSRESVATPSIDGKFYPSIFVCLDGKTGETISINKVEGVDPYYQMGSFMSKTISDTKVIPESILIKDINYIKALEPLAEAYNIDLIQTDPLNFVFDFKQEY